MFILHTMEVVTPGEIQFVIQWQSESITRGLFYTILEGIVVESSSLPDLDGDTVYVRGTDRHSDNRIATSYGSARNAAEYTEALDLLNKRDGISCGSPVTTTVDGWGESF